MVSSVIKPSHFGGGGSIPGGSLAGGPELLHVSPETLKIVTKSTGICKRESSSATVFTAATKASVRTSASAKTTKTAASAKTSTTYKTLVSAKSSSASMVPTNRKGKSKKGRGPSIVDLQVHDGEYEDLFAIEAMIATLASTDAQESYYGAAEDDNKHKGNNGRVADNSPSKTSTTPNTLNAPAAASSKGKMNKRLPLLSTRKWPRKHKQLRLLRSPVPNPFSKKHQKVRQKGNDCQDDDGVNPQAYDNNDGDDSRDGPPLSDNGETDKEEEDDVGIVKTWMSSVFEEGVKFASATFRHDDHASTAGAADEDGQDFETVQTKSEEVLEQIADHYDENELLLWEKAKILADTALQSGNHVAALEMYLVSRELIDRYLEEKNETNGQSLTLMRTTWAEADVLHSTGVVFSFLAKEVALDDIDPGIEESTHLQQTQMLLEAKVNLLDSLALKQGILSDIDDTEKNGEGKLSESPFNASSKQDPDRIKLDLSLASTLRLLGNTNAQLGILEDAKEQLRDARSIHLGALIEIRSLGANCDPSLQWENKIGLAMISYSCGDLFTAMDETDNALEAYSEALGMVAEIPEASPMIEAANCRAGIDAHCVNNTDFTVDVYNKISECQYREKKWNDVLFTLSKALNLLVKQLETTENSAPGKCGQTSSPSCKKCVDFANRVVSPRLLHIRLYRTYSLCAKVYLAIKDQEEATRAREEAQKAKQQAFREQSPDEMRSATVLISILDHAGQHYEENNDNKMALKLYRVALELCEVKSKATSKHALYLKKYWSLEGFDPEIRCDLWRRVAWLHTTKNETIAALAAYRRSISTRICAASLDGKPKDISVGSYFQDDSSTDDINLVKRRINISHHDRDIIKSLQGIESIVSSLRSRTSKSNEHSDAPLFYDKIVNSKETPFRTALDVLSQEVILQSSKKTGNYSKRLAAIVLYRVGMVLWKKEKNLEHSLACMVKSLELSIYKELKSGQDLTLLSDDKNVKFLQLDEADVLESVGGIQLELGNYEEAKLAIIGALQEQQNTIANRANEQEKSKNIHVTRWKIARLSMKAGVLHFMTGEIDTAEQLLKNALSIIKRARASPRLGTNSAASKTSENKEFFDAMAADILHQLGLVLARKGDRSGASDAYNEAKVMLRKAGNQSKIRRIEDDINDLDRDDERSLEETVDLSVMDLYDANSSISTSNDWQDVERDLVGCGMGDIIITCT